MACTDRVCSTLWVALASGYNDRRTHDEACRSFKRSSLSEAGSGGSRFGYHSFASCRKAGFVDTCRAGMTCIEDYGDSTRRGMASFYEALDRTSSSHPDHDGLVRIAVFGDSFIEADIFTADLREMLQKRFGGCGVGFVTITSTIAKSKIPDRKQNVSLKHILT